MPYEPQAECNVWYDGRYLQLKINGGYIPCQKLKIEQNLDNETLITVSFTPTELDMCELSKTSEYIKLFGTS